VDANGILNVTATEKSTGKSDKITVTNDKGRLSADDIEKLVQEAEEYKKQDTEERERVEAKNTLDNAIFSFRGTIDKLESEDDKTSAKEILETAQTWLDDHPSASKEDYDEQFKIIQGQMMQYMAKTAPEGGAMPEGMETDEMPEVPIDDDDDDGPRIEEVD